MYKKTYLSRAMTRAWSMDAPVGDPFGGPAFGERNAPVAAAVVTFFEAATVFEAVAAIGTTLSVVGMVTGNQSLAKIGGVMGLVGGVGAMAQGGMFGGTMQEWANGVSNSVSSNISSAATTTDAFSIGEVVSPSVAGSGASTAIDTGGGLNLEQLSNAEGAAKGMVEPADAGASGLIDTPPQPQIQIDPATTGPQAENKVLGLDANGKALPGDAGMTTGPTSVAEGAAKGTVEPAASAESIGKGVGNSGPNTGTSLLDRIGTSIEKNKELYKLGAEFIKGSYQSPSVRAKLEADARQSDATTNLYNVRADEIRTQGVNASAVPTVGMTVNRNAPIYNPRPVTAAGVRPAGLIQGG